MRALAILSTLTTFAACGPVYGQVSHSVSPTQDQLSVMLAVVHHLRDGIERNATLPPVLDVRIAREIEDLRPPREQQSVRVWSEDALQVIAARLNAEVVPAGEVYQCGQDSLRFWYCSMRGADVLIRLGEPQFEGEIAVITVNFTKRVRTWDDPEEAFTTVTTKELRRRKGTWEVVRNRSVVAH